MNQTPEDVKKICRVLKTEPDNYNTTSLYLENGGDQFTERKAGQYATLRIVQDEGWSKPHPFTISCAPEDKVLRFTIKKAGIFTASIPTLKPGTPVACDGPFGVFCKDIDMKDKIVMIAGGVGITPFLSVLRHFKNLGAKNQVNLFWSNKARVDVFAANELREMARELNLKVIHTLSREQEPEQYSPADTPRILYVTGYVTRELLQEHIDFLNTSFFLCGPPKMQDFVVGELQACGIDPEAVERENFTYQAKPKP